MTTDQIKTKLSRLVADWKIVAEAYEINAKAALAATWREGEVIACAKASVYRDLLWELEQIIKEEE